MAHIKKLFLLMAVLASGACAQVPEKDGDDGATADKTEPESDPDLSADEAPEGRRRRGGGDFDLEKMRAESLAKIDVEACEAEGGSVERAGMLGLFRCVIPYEDAEALCSDASDCAGRCLSSTDVTDFQAPPGEGVGRCEINDSPFGCYAVIDNGVVGPTLCVD